jgi:hypothetical protein
MIEQLVQAPRRLAGLDVVERRVDRAGELERGRVILGAPLLAPTY